MRGGWKATRQMSCLTVFTKVCETAQNLYEKIRPVTGKSPAVYESAFLMHLLKCISTIPKPIPVYHSLRALLPTARYAGRRETRGLLRRASWLWRRSLLRCAYLPDVIRDAIHQSCRLELVSVHDLGQSASAGLKDSRTIV